MAFLVSMKQVVQRTRAVWSSPRIAQVRGGGSHHILLQWCCWLGQCLRPSLFSS
jgi:hypothetical protein